MTDAICIRPITAEEQERDDILLAWLKELRIAHPTAFASVIVQCPDGSYHHTSISNERSAHAEEHQRVTEAICIGIATASDTVMLPMRNDEKAVH